VALDHAGPGLQAVGCLLRLSALAVGGPAIRFDLFGALLRRDLVLEPTALELGFGPVSPNLGLSLLDAGLLGARARVALGISGGLLEVPLAFE
jgi:hypothetical protein